MAIAVQKITSLSGTRDIPFNNLVLSQAKVVALRIFVLLNSSMGGTLATGATSQCTRPFWCTHNVPKNAGCHRTVANRTGR